MDDAGVVQIRPDGGGFMVECIPPEPAYPPQSFAEHRAARGFAGGCRLVLGRKMVDLTGEGGSHG